MVGIDLSGKTALITGGGRGLGRATAGVLKSAGAAVVINYADLPDSQNRELAEQAADELAGTAVAADVRDSAAVERMFDDVIARHGRLDIVVNNAAVMRDRSLRNMTDAEWQDVIDTNLTGVFHVCRAAAPRMTDGGRIINMASISGAVGFFGQSNYAAAKAGVVGLTKVLSKELASRGITVNAVAPGVVLTEMGKSIPESVRERMLSEIPLRRFGEPEDIANAILFLASDLASYVNGQTLHVSGGWWT